VSGVVVGGWEYVWAAYAITAAVLIGYTVSLAVRWRSARERALRQTEER
jgi:hypothetical protein